MPIAPEQDEASADYRIGIDGDALRMPLSGVGHYILNLCRELDVLLPKARFFIYTRFPIERIAVPAQRWTVRCEPWRWARRIPSFLWLKTRGRTMARRDRLDVFWAGRTIHPGLGVAKRVVSTVHDLNHHLVPQTMEWPTRCSHRLWFDRDVRSADLICANSQGTSDRLRQWVGRSADLVVYPGVRAEFHPLDEAAREQALRQLAPLGIEPPYVLSVSTLEPRKNIGALIKAFVRLKQCGLLPQHRLVLVGAAGWQNRALEQTIQASAEHGVLLAGYVPDALMPGLFALADVLVMPSLYEGFGLPVLEARAVHTPTIISDVPELKEAAAGQAQVVLPEAGAIGLALLRLKPRGHGAGLGAQPSIHTWATSALRMRDVLLARP